MTRTVAIPERIRDAFASGFPTHQGLRLPVQAELATPRTLSDGGWWIAYRVDEGPDGLAITYFAHHRMTDDALYRIDSGGRLERLDGAQFGYLADDPQAEAQYVAHHRRFYAEVARLGLDGGAPAAAVINAYLRSGGGPEE